MKLRQTDLQLQLKKELAPLYLLSGSESVILMELVAAIKQKALAMGYMETPIIDIETGFQWQSLRQNLSQQSLFAERELIILRFSSNKVNQEAQAFFKALSQHLPHEKILIVLFNKLETAQLNSVWFKTIEAKSIFIPCWPLQGFALQTWIQQQLQHYGIGLEKAALPLLQEYCDNNLLALQQAIIKLSLIYPKSLNISAAALAEVLFQHSQYTLFDLADAILAQDAAKVLKIFDILIAEETELTLILWILARETRTIYQLFMLLQQGISLAAAFKKLAIFEKRQPLFKKAQMLFKQAEALLPLLERASRIDLKIKTGLKAEAQRELISLALAMAGYTITKVS